MSKKKVLAITGIRSEYEILFPVIDALRNDPGIDLKLAVSGAHLSDWHGDTLKKIEEDGLEAVDRIDNLLLTNRKTQRAKGVGILTTALTQTVERESPDFLFAIGDREEAIATALVGNYMDVLVLHLGGGDPVYSNADDPIRFAVSKLAHIHLTIAEEYSQNLKAVGEQDFRIHWVGNPSLDNIKNTAPMSTEQLSEFLKFDITDGRYIFLIKHPLSGSRGCFFK